MARVFVVEDDISLKNELGKLLDLEGLEWSACDDFSQATEQALAAQADCIVLDVMLPGVDGRVVAREIRALSTTPIIMLTCLDSEFDEVMALNAGADDYLVKPYKPAVLLARINAQLRRAGQEVVRTELEHKGVRLDVGSGIATFEDASTELTRNEARILALLMKNPGVIISRQELMCDLWESDAFVDDNTLTVNVNRVRKALEQIGVPDDFLITKRGLGYMV